MSLPVSAVSDEYKLAKLRALLTCRESRDPKVKFAGVEVKTGKQWGANAASQEAESRRRQNQIVWTTVRAHQGLGFGKTYEKKTTHRESIIHEIRELEKEKRTAQAASHIKARCMAELANSDWEETYMGDLEKGPASAEIHDLLSVWPITHA